MLQSALCLLPYLLMFSTIAGFAVVAAPVDAVMRAKCSKQKPTSMLSKDIAGVVVIFSAGAHVSML